jgi:hypothetical protein
VVAVAVVVVAGGEHWRGDARGKGEGGSEKFARHLQELRRRRRLPLCAVAPTPVRRIVIGHKSVGRRESGRESGRGKIIAG